MLRVGLLTAALLVAGCGPGDPPAGLVEGTVRLNGRPLTLAQVMFLPAGGGPLASGYTDDAGRYALTTEATGRPGVVAGRCVVLVRDLSGWNGDAPPGGRPRVPARYATATDSPLAVEVVPGPQTHDLNLTAP